MKKISWLVLSCLLAAALVLAACRPASLVEEKPPVKEPTPVEKPLVEEPIPTSVVEAPRHGGTFNMVLSADIIDFDDVVGEHWRTYTAKLTNDELFGGDWARGPAGSGECTWVEHGVNRIESKAPRLAESWDIPDNETMIFHIRKGVRYALNPASEASRLVGGRELTAEDIVLNVERTNTDPRSYFVRAYRHLAETTTATAPDKYTVVFKYKPEYFGDFITLYPDFMCIYPPELLKKYENLKDWRNSVGTGPFILTDFLPAGSATLVRNPGFWDKDPVGPGKGNQLPYLDGVRFLIITDESTRYAALRAGKIDLCGVSVTEAPVMMKTNPELKYNKWLPSSAAEQLFMRTDKKELPVGDVRVRQALYLALDNEKIKRDLHGGEAELLCWPITYVAEYAGAYLPLEELPEDVRELYGYNPEKAKRLLAEAGYPDGFKTRIVCYNTPAYIDRLSLVKDMWAEVGVELIIEPKEYAVWISMLTRRAYDEMFFGYNSGIGTYFKMINMWGTSMYNGSYIDDPVVNEYRGKMEKAIMDRFNEARMDELNRELTPHLLRQAYVITLPYPYAYLFWQPWVKNYHGELAVGYYNYYDFLRWVWLDLDLRKAAIGK